MTKPNIPDPTAAYSGTEFYKRYQHLRAPRTARSINNLSFMEFGYLMDTQLDLLQAGLLAETCAKIPMDDDPTLIKPHPLPPDYVYNYFGDFRLGTSFFRPDKHDADSAEPAEPSAKLQGIAKFAQTVHAESRKFPAALFKKAVKWPPEVLVAEEALDKVIKSYRSLVQDNGANYTKIPSDQAAKINGEVIVLLDQLDKALGQMEQITVTLPTGTITIPNKKQLHPSLPNSSTANVLYGLQTAAKGVANLRQIPPDCVVHSMNTIGAESLLTDAVQCVMDEISPDGQLYNSALAVFRRTLETHVKNHTHDLRMLGLFHRILDSAYPLAYDDVDRLLNLCGEKDNTAIDSLQKPKEVAVILYASAKRIAKEPSLDKTLSPSLLTLAESISKLQSPAKMQQVLAEAAVTIDALKQLADQSGIEPLQRAAGLIIGVVRGQGTDSFPTQQSQQAR